jgi:guanylate kinase
MSSRKDGIMIVLSSPSGAGKTTLVKLLSKNKNNFVSISYTTRKPRINEKNKKDYFFVSQKNFKSLIKKKSLLEYAKVFNNYYGTSKKKVIQELKKGKNVLFDIDWQGTEKIKRKKLNFDLLTIFILPPSKKVLFKRLSNRDMKDKLIVGERMKLFEKDVIHWRKYNYVVINNKLDNCLSKIIKVIHSKLTNKKIIFNKASIREHVKKLAN